MKNLVYKIDGNNGRTLKVFEDGCIISVKPGLKSALLGALSFVGDKEIYFRDITSLSFNNLGKTSGYLQFEYPGSSNKNPYENPNSFVFMASIGSHKYHKLRKEMPVVYEYIKKQIEIVKQNQNANNKPVISPADEILKYKELLDKGIITNFEFDEKKKQLLNL